MRLTDEQRALVEANIGVAERAVAERVKRFGSRFVDSYRESAYYALCLAAAKPVPPGMTFEQFAFKRCHWQIIDDIRAVKIQSGTKRAWMKDRSYKKVVFSESDGSDEYGQIGSHRDKTDWVAAADAKMDADQFMGRLPDGVRNTLHSMFYRGDYRGRYTQETWFVKKSAAMYAGDTASRFYLFVRNNLVRADGWMVRANELRDRFNAAATHSGDRVSIMFVTWWMRRHGFTFALRGDAHTRYVVGLSWRFPNEQPASDRVVSGVRPVDSAMCRIGRAGRACHQRKVGIPGRTGPSPAAALAKPRSDQGGVGESKGGVGRTPKRQRRRQDHARKLRRRRAIAGGKG